MSPPARPDAALRAAVHADGSPRGWDMDIPTTLARLRAICDGATSSGDAWERGALAGAGRLLGEEDPAPDGVWELVRYADSGLVVGSVRVRGRTLRVWARFARALDLRVELEGVALLEGSVAAPGPSERRSLRTLLRGTHPRPTLAGARAQGRKARIEGAWGPLRRLVRIEGTRVVVLDTRPPEWPVAVAGHAGVDLRLPESAGADGPGARWRTVLEWRPTR